jgi:hypothetical protein
VVSASLIALCVIAEVRRIKLELLGDEGAQCRRGLLAFLEDKAWKSQVAEHQGEAKAIRLTAVSIDQHHIFGAQGVVTNHLAFIARGGIEQEPLRLGEQFSAWHGCPF